MNDAQLGIALLWGLVFIYSMTGSVDFGAGFWAMLYHRHKDASAATVANRYLSPLWEVTNVFLVLFAVALVGLFPRAAYALGSILLVPGDLILILLTIRTVFMVFAHVVHKYQFSLRVISGVTGLLIPALLMLVFPVAQGGAVTVQGDTYYLSLRHVLANWNSYTYILLGLTSELFISSTFLADYARAGGDQSAFRVYRRNALIFGPAAMISALLVPITLPGNAKWLRTGLTHQVELLLISALLFLITIILLWSTKTLSWRSRAAVITTALQYLFAVTAYGRAHLPYILYPDITVTNSFTNSEMFRAAAVVLVVGIAVLFPGFVWLWRLFLEDKSYLRKAP